VNPSLVDDTVIGVADGPVVLDKTFEWRGACVRWARFGDGPPVVACHGTPWSSFVWRSVIDALQDDRCVYVWDMVGYGQSDKPDNDVSLGTQGELFAALFEALLREYISGASATGLRPDVMDALVAPWLGEGQAAFYRQIAQADERFTDEIERRYCEISVPTLIIWGTDDGWIPRDRAERLQRLISSSVVEYIERAGHLVQEDQPAAFTAAIHRWIHEHPR
jgi:pimeloyl-ACP methyl ester carboxylesterase